MNRTFVPGVVKASVGPREIEVIASTGAVDRMGDVLVPVGAQLANYRKNPVVLAQHDATAPIARCSTIGLQGDRIVARVLFPDAGVNALSDQYLGLAKAGVIGAVSVGFMPLAAEPLRETGGLRYTAWELLELSLVSIPANSEAVVTAKRLRPTPRLDAARAKLARIRRRIAP